MVATTAPATATEKPNTLSSTAIKPGPMQMVCSVPPGSRRNLKPPKSSPSSEQQKEK
jgi:hypothetical protein